MSATVAGVLTEHSCCLSYIGAITVSYLSLKLLCSLWSGIKTYILAGGIDLKRLGEWAVVTGATDGIGKAYAFELARRGINVVLISRTQEKLDDVAKLIEAKYPVKTKCVAIDFTGGPEIYDKARRELTGLDIGVLINNVGMSSDHPQYYLEVSDKRIRDVVNVNTHSVTMMTRIVLPSMVEKKKGVIVNVASASGVTPSPLLTTYSATKAFVDFFSRALHTEYKSKGIIVQSVVPFFVATKMSKIRKASFMAPGPDTYAKSALNTIGNETRTYGCLSHALQGWVVGLVPESIYNAMSTRLMLGARKRALKKLTKNQ